MTRPLLTFTAALLLATLAGLSVMIRAANAECRAEDGCTAAVTAAGTPQPAIVVGMVAADGTYPPPPPPPSPSPSPSPSPTPDGPVVYLTFDDGPTPSWTPRVLEILARYGAKATFFAVGTNLDAYPAQAAAVVAGGHAIGLHGNTHAYLTRLTWAGVSDDLARNQAALQRATQRRSTCLRPPYGAINATVRDVAAARGLTVQLWNVDPRDWERPGVNAIVDNVLRNVRPGAVVLFHDGGGDRSQTVAALEILLPRLASRGYRFEALPCLAP